MVKDFQHDNQKLHPYVKRFMDSGFIKFGELSQPKKEKPESTGALGRPTSEKTLMAKDINSKMEADANYKPSEEELATLGAEFIETLRARVNGTLKRGRKPASAAKASDGMVKTMKNIMNTTDKDGDGDVDDEDLDLNIAESVIKHKKQPMNEQFLRMQKLAGLITESEFKKNLKK
jgi:hypothetical protein